MQNDKKYILLFYFVSYKIGRGELDLTGVMWVIQDAKRAEVPILSFNTIQAGRAAAAIVVLLFHTEVTLGLDKYIGHDIFPIWKGGNAGVEFFFVLSGFIILFAHSKDVGNTKNLGRYIFRRTTRLIPPLWIALILTTIGGLYVGVNDDTILNLRSIIKDLLVLPSEDNSRLSVEWTLRHEIIFYIVFSVFIINIYAGFFLSFLFLLFTFINMMHPFSFPFSKIFALYNILFYFGATVFLLRGFVRYNLAIILFFGGALMFCATWWYKLLIADGSSITIIFFGVASALIISGMVGVEAAGKVSINRLFVYMGNASFSIYLIHFPAISALSKLVVKTRGILPFPDWLCFVVVSAGALLCGFMFHEVVERPIMRICRKYERDVMARKLA